MTRYPPSRGGPPHHRDHRRDHRDYPPAPHHQHRDNRQPLAHQNDRRAPALPPPSSSGNKYMRGGASGDASSRFGHNRRRDYSPAAAQQQQQQGGGSRMREGHQHRGAHHQNGTPQNRKNAHKAHHQYPPLPPPHQHPHPSQNFTVFPLQNIIHPTNKFNNETTLFISHIPQIISNEHVQSILEQLGTVKSWNRLKETNTEKWKQSGFVCYVESAAACRALRLLRSVTLMGHTLLVNCDTNTKERLRRFKEQTLRDFALLRHWNGSVKDSECITHTDIEAFFENQQDEDHGIEELINEIVQKINESQNITPHSTQLAVESSVDRFLMGGSREETEEKRNMLSHEIKRFRQMEKQRNEGVMQREKLRQMEHERHRERILEMAAQKERARVEEQKRRDERMKQYKERAFSNLLRKEERREESLKRKRELGEDGMPRSLKKRLMHDERAYYYGKKELPEQKARPTPEELAAIAQAARDKSPPRDAVIGARRAETPQNLGPRTTAATLQPPSHTDEAKPSRDSAMMPSLEQQLVPVAVKNEDQEEEIMQEETRVERREIKALVVDRDTLFAMEANWGVVAQYDLLGRLKPFLEKTVMQLLGVKEDTLIEYVMALFEVQADPNTLKSELQEVLSEEDINDFVEKVWRELLRMQEEVQVQDS